MRPAVRLALASSFAAPAVLALACGGAPSAPAAAPCPQGPAAPGAPAAAAAPNGPATVDEARAFVAQVDKDLHELWAARDRAAWVSQTYITDDTEALAAAGEAATAAYVTKKVHEAARYNGLALPDDVARQLLLLRLAQIAPAPSDPKKASELAGIEAAMTGAYGKGQHCPAPGSKLAPLVSKGQTCMHLDDLERVLSTSHDPAVLAEAWDGWHATARAQKERFTRYATLANEGARELGFADVGSMWRSGYDMPPEEFRADVERLWTDVKPLYDELHCYVRARLRAKYGSTSTPPRGGHTGLVPERGPIPAHLVGNMWAQDWSSLYDLAVPFRGEPSLDAGKALVAKKVDAKGMVKMGESFFTSLGFDPLPATFWERSQLTRPRDREVVCHASAWDVTWSDDLRVKMCIEPTERELVTIHHELGHDFYFSQYPTLPVLFQQGANDGFHEGIGDTIALSVTPQYLKGRGLLGVLPTGDKTRLNQQMKMALEKVPFLPFGLLIDKWRWDVFAGKVTPDHYDAAWWELKRQYQGVAPPDARTESDFDPAAKYHVASSTPYIRYFLAFVYQFQFHRALCKAAGYTGPLDQCSIYGNDAAGKKLRAMLSLGASKPWQDAMQVVSGERKADASAILDYFAPLRGWLKDQIKDEKCGW
jgi:peptidyl-dipeptidase A